MSYDGMTRTEQVDSWFARLTAWMREVCGPKSVPPHPPPFVWDMLRAEARRLDGPPASGSSVSNVLASAGGDVQAAYEAGRRDEKAQLWMEQAARERATSGLAGQPPAPIDQLNAHDSAATQAAVALLKNVAHHLDEAVLARCTSVSLADLRSDVHRALELLGVKP